MAGKRSALIIATSQYKDPDIRKLISPAQDAKALIDILKDSGIGGFEEVKELLDRPSFEINVEIETFFNKRSKDDLLLLYFSCHGMKDDEGHLYFATTNTCRETLYSTAISADFVNTIMKRSRSKRQVLLLDCCYSGAFAKGMIAKAGDEEIHTKEHFDGYGKIILTASDAVQYSFEGDNLKKVGAEEAIAPGSVFTQAILEGLKSGNADLNKDGQISPDELYEYTYEFVRRITPLQTPGKYALGVEGSIVIANALIQKESKESEYDQDEETLKLLLNGRISEFNRNRRDAPLSYQKVDLSRKVLPKADLHDIDFTGAKFVNTILRKAILYGAIFKDADLSGADLKNTDLDGAHLAGANLSGANLTGANLKDADLKGSINFEGANLTGADFKYTELTEGNINFEGAKLDNADFTRANIDTKLVNFKGAIIDDVVGLPKDLLLVGDNKYVKDIKAFSEFIEKQFKSLNVGAEQVKSIEESVQELTKEVHDISDGEKRLSDIRKQNVKTKLVAVLKKVTDILPKPDEQTHDVFDSLKSFEKLIEGEEIQQLAQNIIVQKKKDNLEASKRHYIEEGAKLQNLGKYKEAIDCFDEALKIKSDDFVTLYYKGLAFYNLSKYEEALQCFEQSLKINPKDNDAAKYKDFAIDKIKKHSAIGWNEKGEELNKQGKYEEALQWFERSLDANPDNAPTLYYKGLAFYNLSKYDEALRCFDKAIMIAPDYAEAYYRKGQALVNLGKHQEAVKCFDNALRIQPSYSEATKAKEAATEIQRRKESALIIQEGLLHLENGNYNSAANSFTKAIDANPNDALAYTYKGNTLYKSQRYEDAIKCFDEALKIKPNDPDPWDLRGRAYFKLEEYEKSLYNYNQALGIKPNSFEFIKDAGLAYDKLGKYDEAIQYYDRALQIKPDVEVTRYKDEAVDKLTKSVSKEPVTSFKSVQFDLSIIGRKVKSIDNQEIGKVHSISSEYVQIQDGGRFSKKYYFIPKYYFESYSGNEIGISLTKLEVTSRFERDTYGRIIQGKQADEKTIYISYGRKDREEANRLFIAMKNTGLNLKLWMDTELLPGQSWEKEIEKALKASRFFILLISSKSVEKNGFTKKQFEYELKVLRENAVTRNIFVVPVRLDDCKIPYPELESLQSIDMFPDWDRGVEKILKALGSI